MRFDWDAMDGWFEEDEEIFTHPRSPYTRVDILDSSRHVRVIVEGVTVAESSGPKLLFETDLPTRFYLPKVDVHMDLLVPTDTDSHCPYKGTARYWSVRVGDTWSPTWRGRIPRRCPRARRSPGSSRSTTSMSTTSSTASSSSDPRPSSPRRVR